MGVQTKLVFYLIPILLLIVVVLVFFSGGGLWEDTKEIAVGAKDSVYESVDFGTESLSADVSISAEHKAEIETLVETIKNLKGKEECFVEFNPLSDLEERGVSISFEKSVTG
ncbi:hypothetical protein CL619_04350, partial [archaeon]|nr:hypothetical protein [archaeon]